MRLSLVYVIVSTALAMPRAQKNSSDTLSLPCQSLDLTTRNSQLEIIRTKFINGPFVFAIDTVPNVPFLAGNGPQPSQDWLNLASIELNEIASRSQTAEGATQQLIQQKLVVEQI